MDAVEYIRRSEGWRGGLYLCREGYPTIGYGFRVGPMVAGDDRAMFDGSGDWLPEEVGEYWLAHLLKQHVLAIMDAIGPEAWRALDTNSVYEMRAYHLREFGAEYEHRLTDEIEDASPRQSALIDAVHQMGPGVFAKFPGFTQAVKGGRYGRAALELQWAEVERIDAGGGLTGWGGKGRRTRYAEQTPERAARNAHIWRRGEFPPGEMWR